MPTHGEIERAERGLQYLRRIAESLEVIAERKVIVDGVMYEKKDRTEELKTIFEDACTDSYEKAKTMLEEVEKCKDWGRLKDAVDYSSKESIMRYIDSTRFESDGVIPFSAIDYISSTISEDGKISLKKVFEICRDLFMWFDAPEEFDDSFSEYYFESSEKFRIAKHREGFNGCVTKLIIPWDELKKGEE